MNPQHNGGNITATREGNPMSANSNATKGNTTLVEGYARLFGGEQEVQLTMADRPKGKRQYGMSEEQKEEA